MSGFRTDPATKTRKSILILQLADVAQIILFCFLLLFSNSWRLLRSFQENQENSCAELLVSSVAVRSIS